MPIVSERFLPIPWMDVTLNKFGNWQGISMVERLRSIQNGTFKYVWSSEGTTGLYDISVDPNEMVNMIDSKPNEAAILRAALEERVGNLRNGGAETNAAH